MTDKAKLDEMFYKSQQKEKEEIIDRLWSLAVFHGWDLDIEELAKILKKVDD